VAYDDLDRPAQLNIDMDDSAKAFLEQLPALATSPQTLQGEGWQLWIAGRKITGDPGPAIRYAAYAPEVQAHLHRNGILNQDDFDLVDWAALRATMQSFPPLYRLWVSKHVAGFFGCGKMMKRWKFWDHSRCPCCAHEYEDKTHLMTCPDPQAVSTWEQSLENFELWLDQADTDPDIADCFLFALASRDPTHDLTIHAAPHVLSAAAEQTRIGWLLLTEGKIARSWRSLQDRHYRNIGSQRTGSSWAKHLITHILSMTHTQWTHRNSVQHDRDDRGLRREE
jgi:hypothetical protein